MTDPIQPLIPLPFVFNSSQRVTRDISQTLTQFLNNLIYNSTTPLSFETYPEDIYTIPLIREHHDSYLFYIDTLSLVANSEELPFSIPFTSSIIALILFEKTSILIIFISQLLMSLQHSSYIYKKKITIYLNMFLTLLPYKTFSKKNLFLTFLILNNFVLLKIIRIIGLLLIFFKFTIFNINSFRILPSLPKQKNKFRYTLFFFENFSDIITNSFGTQNSKMLA